MPDCPPALTADQVADLLAAVAQGHARVTAEADRIVPSPAGIRVGSVAQLTRLAEQVSAARRQLAAVDLPLLLDGMQLWLCRRGVPKTPVERAHACWGGVSA